MRRILDIYGLGCSLAGDPAPLAQVVGHVVRHLGLPERAGGRADLTVTVTEGLPPNAPSGTPDIVHGDDYLRVWRSGDRVVLRTAALHLTVDPERGTATGTVSPEGVTAPGLVPEMVVGVLSALFLMLRPRGFFPLHAAALARGERGLLLVAESDAGKSTTAFRLVQQGWDYLSDDSVLLRPGPEAVAAVALRRTFGLDLGAEALFPELAGIEDRQPSDPAKRSVPMTALYPAQATLCCRPRTLVFPEIVDRAESMLVPMSGAEALLGLAGQSPLLSFRPDWSREHLALLGRLVNQTEAYRLRAGRDLLHDPRRIVHLLDTVWPEPLLAAAPALHA